MSKLTTALMSLMVLGCSTLPTSNSPSAEPAQQRTTCPLRAPAHTIAACLALHFGELPTAGGLLSNGNLAQILVNPETGTWTAIEIRPDGNAQISGTGTHWMSMEQADGTAAHFTPIHEWYKGLKNSSGTSCCGGYDCKSYPHRRTEGELAFEALVNDRWVRVPPDKILGMFSPDGEVHLCCYGGHCDKVTNPHIRCAIVPGAGV